MNKIFVEADPKSSVRYENFNLGPFEMVVVINVLKYAPNPASFAYFYSFLNKTTNTVQNLTIKSADGVLGI